MVFQKALRRNGDPFRGGVNFDAAWTKSKPPVDTSGYVKRFFVFAILVFLSPFRTPWQRALCCFVFVGRGIQCYSSEEDARLRCWICLRMSMSLAWRDVLILLQTVRLSVLHHPMVLGSGSGRHRRNHQDIPGGWADEYTTCHFNVQLNVSCQFVAFQRFLNVICCTVCCDSGECAPNVLLANRQFNCPGLEMRSSPSLSNSFQKQHPEMQDTTSREYLYFVFVLFCRVFTLGPMHLYWDNC